MVITKKLEVNDNYNKLGKKTKDNIISFVSGLNDELLQELDITDEISAGEFADTLLNTFSNNQDFSKAWKQLFG